MSWNLLGYLVNFINVHYALLSCLHVEVSNLKLNDGDGEA